MYGGACSILVWCWGTSLCTLMVILCDCCTDGSDHASTPAFPIGVASQPAFIEVGRSVHFLYFSLLGYVQVPIGRVSNQIFCACGFFRGRSLRRALGSIGVFRGALRDHRLFLSLVIREAAFCALCLCLRGVGVFLPLCFQCWLWVLGCCCFARLMHQVYGKLSGTGIALHTEGSRASTCS
jgi:hypothetical protein